MSESQETPVFQAPEPEQLAAYFPGYEIKSLIAAGGMGAVYHAVQRSLDRPVAIKILPRESNTDAAFCAAFEAEAKAMARLNHPNLIGVYDFGEADGMLYIVMEYVDGESLHHASHGIAIDSKDVIRLISGIGSGLAHAHENGILHRDIKPSNILLDINAQPKIGDFGLASPVERTMKEGEEIFGTPHYTAPEVVEAPHLVDYRADIFSLGVLLHELITGRLPADDPRPPSQIIRCDPRFDAIVQRATHPDPRYRYTGVKEMVGDLQAILTARSTAKPVTAPTPPNTVVTAPPRPGGVHGQAATAAVRTSAVPARAVVTPVTHAVPVPGARPAKGGVPRKATVYRKKTSEFPWMMVCSLVLLAVLGGVLFIKYRSKPPVAPPVMVDNQAPAAEKREVPEEADDDKKEEVKVKQDPASNPNANSKTSKSKSSVFGKPVEESQNVNPVGGTPIPR